MNFQTFRTLLKFVKLQWRECKGGHNQTTVSKMLGMTLCYLWIANNYQAFSYSIWCNDRCLYTGKRINYEGFDGYG